MSFVDEAKIYVNGGHGGKGCRSFERSRYFKHPKPNGGNGGCGGDVIVIADNKIRTLLDYRYQQHFSAVSGGHGGSNNKQGRDGGDCIIKVPLGTSVKDFQTGYLLRDLEEHAQKVVVAKGSAGGLGNSNSRVVSEGKSGEQRTLKLELKLIADIGIVGFPNAGKSTLISCLTNARPKIASYPFTTKVPVLGKLEINDVVMTIADLPGLIEGAHEGKGLGDRFLRHVEKTRLLIHLVDFSGVESDPTKNYQTLNNELKFYSSTLISKQQIIVANKMDLPDSRDNLEKFKKAVKKRVYPISALEKQGIEELLKAIKKEYEKTISA